MAPGFRNCVGRSQGRFTPAAREQQLQGAYMKLAMRLKYKQLPQ